MLLRWLLRIVIIILLIWLIPYSWTLIFATITAVLLEGAVRFFQKKCKDNRLIGVTITFICYIGSLLALAYITVSVLVKQAITLAEKAPGFVKDIYQSLVLPNISKWETYTASIPENVIPSMQNMMERGITSLEGFTQTTVEALIAFAGFIPGFLIEFIIYLVGLFLISLELPNLKEKFKLLINPVTYQKISLVVNDLMKAGVGFLKAQIVLSVITFIMAFVGLSILGVPYTLLVSILIVVVDILPILGTGSVLVPWATVAILQGNTSLGIGLIILFLVITVVRRMVEPKVYSANMGLSPLAALISLYLGFKVMGVVGLFVGPALVIVYETLKKAGVIKWKVTL
ncbi:MAG: sporulation integral membrane protein YtvI [Bacillus sp. (in: firmicutes)]